MAATDPAPRPDGPAVILLLPAEPPPPAADAWGNLSAAGVRRAQHFARTLGTGRGHGLAAEGRRGSRRSGESSPLLAPPSPAPSPKPSSSFRILDYLSPRLRPQPPAPDDPAALPPITKILAPRPALILASEVAPSKGWLPKSRAAARGFAGLRPRQTVEPLARALGLKVEQRLPAEAWKDAVEEIRGAEGTVVVCWEREGAEKIGGQLLSDEGFAEAVEAGLAAAPREAGGKEGGKGKDKGKGKGKEAVAGAEEGGEGGGEGEQGGEEWTEALAPADDAPGAKPPSDKGKGKDKPKPKAGKGKGKEKPGEPAPGPDAPIAGTFVVNGDDDSDSGLDDDEDELDDGAPRDGAPAIAVASASPEPMDADAPVEVPPDPPQQPAKEGKGKKKRKDKGGSVGSMPPDGASAEAPDSVPGAPGRTAGDGPGDQSSAPASAEEPGSPARADAAAADVSEPPCEPSAPPPGNTPTDPDPPADGKPKDKDKKDKGKKKPRPDPADPTDAPALDRADTLSRGSESSSKGKGKKSPDKEKDRKGRRVAFPPGPLGHDTYLVFRDGRVRPERMLFDAAGTPIFAPEDLDPADLDRLDLGDAGGDGGWGGEGGLGTGCCWLGGHGCGPGCGVQ